MFYKVFDDIYLVGGMSYSEPADCCVYFLSLKAGILIDAGLGRYTDRILDNIIEVTANPNDIKYLLLTHCHIDHIGGAKELKDKLGLKTYAHEKDVDAITNGDRVLTAADWYNIDPTPIEVDVVLKGDGGSILNIPELKWLHTPGHTPGSVVFLYETEEMRVLFGQDIHGPLSSEFKSNQEDYRSSLKRLIELNADILCEGHYGVIKGREKVRGFIERFL